jgi:hypothetical protein
LSLTGFLNNFSLAEILQVIDSGSKSGKLIVRALEQEEKHHIKGSYHLWFDRGNLVAINNNITNPNLLSFAEKQGLVDRPNLEGRLGQLCSTIEPIGSCLHRHGNLTKQQLELILQTQLEEIYQLFEVSFGWFKFEDLVDREQMPWKVMTGESIESRQITLNGLRKLTNWQHLESVLPTPNSLLEQIVIQHNFKLEPLEFKLWKFADGQTSLDKFSEVLNQPIVKVQRAAYGLIMAELIEAIPVFDVPKQKFSSTNNNWISSEPKEPKLASVSIQSVKVQPKPSNSLVGNLLRFLGKF